MAEENKTEPGTAHKREEARKEGQIARSHDLSAAAGMLAAIGALAWFSGGGVTAWRTLMGQLLEEATRPGASIGLAQFRATFLLALRWTAWAAGAAWMAGTAVAFQGGFVLVPAALFKPGRLQPGQNVKNMFSAASWSRTARSILPVTVIGWLTYGLVAQSWPVLVRSSAMPVSAALDWLSGMMVSLAWRGGMVLLAWAGVDYCLQRRTHESALKMSKQEVKEESKELQGSPETKGRIRRIQRQMARRRMMREVPGATVVITNPTEYAIALKYVPETMAAPVVVAKGRMQVAGRIRALAVGAGVPIVENRPLARALYRTVEIGAPIPGKFYAAVAEILAFLRRAQNQRRAMEALPGRAAI